MSDNCTQTLQKNKRRCEPCWANDSEKDNQNFDAGETGPGDEATPPTTRHIIRPKTTPKHLYDSPQELYRPNGFFVWGAQEKRAGSTIDANNTAHGDHPNKTSMHMRCSISITNTQRIFQVSDRVGEPNNHSWTRQEGLLIARMLQRSHKMDLFYALLIRLMSHRSRARRGGLGGGRRIIASMSTIMDVMLLSFHAVPFSPNPFPLAGRLYEQSVWRFTCRDTARDAPPLHIWHSYSGTDNQALQTAKHRNILQVAWTGRKRMLSSEATTTHHYQQALRHARIQSLRCSKQPNSPARPLNNNIKSQRPLAPTELHMTNNLSSRRETSTSLSIVPY
ncbi:hypothetical protein FN846DRAFT_895870 [Sphaerosporella brunnea]|uniref:Uncharacterized protein n=1 Tax=Sphaerosporella brunnea TaxID=1250544 RepID=A0A5J5EDB4_9PEZI|nr:hypothetical protein FN846DRAFT_895870 [Sphaerosporella brunnea]